MKLSEAIALSGMMTPQGRAPESIVSADAPCALGGALQSIGRQPKDKTEAYWVLYEEWWPVFGDKEFICPCGSAHDYSPCRPNVIAIITMLDVYHGWSRTQIAEWVATVEPQ